MGHRALALSAELFPLLEETTASIMLSLSLATLVTLAASPFLRLPEASAYNNNGAPPPALWLATLRNATGATAPSMNGPGVRSIRFSAGQ